MRRWHDSPVSLLPLLSSNLSISLLSTSRVMNLLSCLVVCVRRLTAEKLTHCALCHKEVCPTTDHIYWFCSHFQHLRQWPHPINDMIARVGWNTNGIQYPIVQQMARIRQALAIITKRNTNQSNLDEGGREGGGGAPLRTLVALRWSHPRARERLQMRH